MIPNLVDVNGDWDVLPPGIHDTTIKEVEAKYAWNKRRRWLFEGLEKSIGSLSFGGCRTIYLDGSFVTAKPNPGDYDMCWDPAGVDPLKIDPVFFDFSNMRANQKKIFRGEFFPYDAAADAMGTIFIDYFQMDRSTGSAKGILKLQI